VIDKRFGRSTILAFSVLHEALDNYKQHLEALINAARSLSDLFDHKKYHDLVLDFDRLSDRLEEFLDILRDATELGYAHLQIASNGEWGYESFFWAHNIIAEGGALIALVAIAYCLFVIIPALGGLGRGAVLGLFLGFQEPLPGFLPSGCIEDWQQRYA
jgi:hypothetical protein